MIHARVIVMKISNSKKELARIISENGGGGNGGCAAQDGDGGGGECPVERESLVDYKLLSGGVCANGDAAGNLIWRHGEVGTSSIIAYRLHKPEQVETVEYNYLGVVYTGPVQSEFVVDEKPTLDKLLQDWRNADDFAKRRQAEADEAAAMRDERWGAVQVRAGEMGVAVGRCDGMVDASELVITDWRNLLVGDIVEIVGSENERWLRFKGVELFVSRTGASERGLVFRSLDGDEWGHGGNTNWRFIRRP